MPRACSALARRRVDDARAGQPGRRACKLALLAGRGTRTDRRQADVRAVEVADRHLEIPQAEPPDDFPPHGRRGRRGQRQADRRPDRLGLRSEPHVVRPEVMAPLADQVRLVHGEQPGPRAASRRWTRGPRGGLACSAHHPPPPARTRAARLPAPAAAQARAAQAPARPAPARLPPPAPAADPGPPCQPGRDQRRPPAPAQLAAGPGRRSTVDCCTLSRPGGPVLHVAALEPVQRVLGDLTPAVVDRERVATILEVHEVRDRR